MRLGILVLGLLSLIASYFVSRDGGIEAAYVIPIFYFLFGAVFLLYIFFSLAFSCLGFSKPRSLMAWLTALFEVSLCITIMMLSWKFMDEIMNAA